MMRREQPARIIEKRGMHRVETQEYGTDPSSYLVSPIAPSQSE